MIEFPEHLELPHLDLVGAVVAHYVKHLDGHQFTRPLQTRMHICITDTSQHCANVSAINSISETTAFLIVHPGIALSKRRRRRKAG